MGNINTDDLIELLSEIVDVMDETKLKLTKRQLLEEFCSDAVLIVVTHPDGSFNIFERVLPDDKKADLTS